MPPHGWTPEELKARRLHGEMTSQGSLGDLSVGQFSEELSRTYGWQPESSRNLAVGVARAEGGFGQRMLERAGTTQRGFESRWAARPVPPANRTAQQVASVDEAAARTRASNERFYAKNKKN